MPRKQLLDVPCEQQSTPYSCAAKCLQLVLNYHDSSRYPLGDGLEMTILEEARLEGYDQATHPGLVLYALDDGFDVAYLTTHDDLYRYPEDPSEHAMDRDVFEEKISVDKRYFERAKKKGVSNVVHDRVTLDTVKPYIDSGRPVVAMTEKRGMLHDVVIRGYKNNLFKVVDPLKRYRSVHREVLEPQINTMYGASLFALDP